jgi:ADP-ribosylglycohydrolase
MTHTDPKAESGAFAVALAASLSASPISSAELASAFRVALYQWLTANSTELLTLLERAADSANRGEATAAFADSLGLQRGVSGYMYHTVPVAIHAWLSHPDDFRAAVLAAIRCGGDTDTLAAIVGGIVGARIGRAGIPAEWLAGLWEWPRSVAWIERLGDRLAAVCSTGTAQRPLPLAVWGVPARNVLFLAVVLAHSFRRLLPPY